MAKRNFIGRLISLHFRDRTTPISGFVMAYDDDWTLMRYREVDYILNGYVLVRHKRIDRYELGESERFAERVISKKGYVPNVKETISLGDLEQMLRDITKRYGVFHAEFKQERRCWIGAFLRKEGKELVYEELSPRAKWRGEEKLKASRIRVIHFDTDYCNSLLLVAGKHKAKASKRKPKAVRRKTRRLS
jgi:hypothetical protein